MLDMDTLPPNDKFKSGARAFCFDHRRCQILPVIYEFKSRLFLLLLSFCFGIQASAFDYFSSATVRPVACCFCWCLSAVVLSAAAVLFCFLFCSAAGKVFLWRFINIFSGLLCWCPLEGEGEGKKRKHRIVRRITACFLLLVCTKYFTAYILSLSC